MNARLRMRGAGVRTALRGRTAAMAAACFWVAGAAPALDPGVIEGQRLNVVLDLPTTDTAISAQEARQAAARHATDVLAGRKGDTAGIAAAYWRDYRSVLETFPHLSEARAVLVKGPDGQPRIARWLVGVCMGNAVGGFLAVDPKDGGIQSRLPFTPRLEPLFRVRSGRWQSAPDVNSIPGLEELVPPLTQFTTGIPVNPHIADVHLIDGVLDLPKKTQEERRETIEAFNRGMGRETGVTLHHTLGRRTATSKCLSVAASYVADWWMAATGGTLSSYRNAVGGQQEYGVNPRHLESLYFQRARAEAGLAGRALLALGNRTGLHMYVGATFKLVGRDRVTGEAIPYAPRGYARILSETQAGSVPDPLVPAHVAHKHGPNPFAMDEPPLLMVIDRNLMARWTRSRDERLYRKRDSVFQVAEWNASRLETPELEMRLIEALNAWGPLYAQHMQRDAKGEPARGLRATGVHACVIVGHTALDGRIHFIYRETFGQASHRYLEDSFLGPSYRAFPIEFFYQAIAFPHTLQLAVRDTNAADDGSVTGTLEIFTNRGAVLLSPDKLAVFIDERDSPGVRFDAEKTGRYRFRIPGGIAAGAQCIEFRAAKRHFTSGDGRSTFTARLVRRDGHWSPVPR